MIVMLVIGGKREDVLRNKVDPDRFFKSSKHTSQDRNLIVLFRNIRYLLRDDQVHLSGEAVTQQPAPLFCTFHIRSCCSFINIEIYQLPIGTKRHRILILPDVVFKIVVVFRLIEVANIDADTIATPGTRLFVPDGF